MALVGRGFVQADRDRQFRDGSAGYRKCAVHLVEVVGHRLVEEVGAGREAYAVPFGF